MKIDLKKEFSFLSISNIFLILNLYNVFKQETDHDYLFFIRNIFIRKTSIFDHNHNVNAEEHLKFDFFCKINFDEFGPLRILAFSLVCSHW